MDADVVEVAQADNGPDEAGARGVLIDSLAILPERAILDQARLADLIGVTTRTVRRMVSRFELPPPTRLMGRSVWFAGRVLAHIEKAVERAERAAEQIARKIRQDCP